MKKILVFTVLLSTIANAQLTAPKITIPELYVTTLDVSWTRVTGATSYTLQRATDAAFTQNLTSVYTGSSPVYRETGLTQNTQYWYRVKATQGAIESQWASTTAKTLWSPSAASQGGNRFATAADVGVGGIWENTSINAGDYVLVGYTQTGGVEDFGGTQCAFGVPAIGSGAGQLNIAAGKKIVFLGGRGYDKVIVNFEGGGNGTSSDSLVITNALGQLRANVFEMWSPQWVKLTGQYDPVRKRGDPNYLGMRADDWSNLSGSFGFYFKGNYKNTGGFCLYIKGDAHDVTVEDFEAGEGNYTGLSVKNDGTQLYSFALPNTSGGWQTVTQTNITIPYPTSTIRLMANWGSSNFKVNWIQFVGASTYTIEAENYATGGSVGTAVQSTSDAGGGQELYNINQSGNYRDFADYNIVIPAGTYTINARISTTDASANLVIRQGSSVFNSLEVCWAYFHDFRQGEAAYSGSTQEDPQQPFSNAKFHHLLLIRAGLNAIQTGQLIGDGNVIENCVGIGTGTAAFNTFQRFQDQTIQQSTRQSGFTIRNNMLGGGGESFITLFMLMKGGYTNTTPNTFKNNLFEWLMGETGGYINTKDPSGVTVNIDSNIFRKCTAGGGRYAALYPWQATPVNYVINFESSEDRLFAVGSGVGTMNATNNIYDDSWAAGGNFVVKSGTVANLTVNEINNVRSTTLPHPQYNNYMDLPVGYDYTKIEGWVWGLSPQWNRYNTTGTEAANGPSSTSLAIPTSHPTAITMTIATIGNSGDVFTILEPGKNFSVGEYVVVKKNVYEESNFFVMQVTSWNATTGQLQGNSVSNQGSGTYNTWTVSRIRTYQQDDRVFYNKRWYKSLVNNNRANQPSLDGDSNWELIVFSNGSLKPVDDVRLPADDYYMQRGMGIGKVPNNEFVFRKRIPAGSDLKRRVF